MVAESNSVSNVARKMLEERLTKNQIDNGYLYTKELMYILGCSERTLIRWRQLRKKGDKVIGISCVKIMDTYRYAIEDIYNYFINNAV